MGVRIGGSIGPVHAYASPRDIGKATNSMLMLFVVYPLYGIYFVYKYLFLAIYWCGRETYRLGVRAYRWHQDRQAVKAAEQQAVRERAEAQHAAYLSGDDQGIYGDYPPAA